jgi:uncharacterized protein (TIGR02466 family)
MSEVIGMDKIPLFATPVWRVHINPATDNNLNADLLKKILSDKTKDPTSPGRDKWYSPRNLHESPELAGFNRAVLSAARTALDSMLIDYKDIEITGCWANVSSPGATHHKHSHPNNYICGVYYVQADEGADNITFHDPRPVTGLIRPPTTGHTSDTAEAAFLSVKPGDLVLFPCWLHHSVQENKSNRDRISIAFNITFSDFMTRMAKPMW